MKSILLFTLIGFGVGFISPPLIILIKSLSASFAVMSLDPLMHTIENVQLSDILIASRMLSIICGASAFIAGLIAEFITW